MFLMKCSLQFDSYPFYLFHGLGKLIYLRFIAKHQREVLLHEIFLLAHCVGEVYHATII